MSSFKLDVRIQDVLAILFYISILVFASDTRGAIVMTALILMIAVIVRPKLKFDLFAKYMLAFGVFSLLSTFWARSPAYAIEKGITILELTLVFAILYSCYYSSSVNRLLKVLMWAGFLLSIYTILFVGVDTLKDALEDEARLESTFANINSIGMVACTSILICIYYNIFEKKNIISLFFCVPPLYVVAASGSRKAFVMLVLGVIVLFYYKQKLGNKKGTGFLSFVISFIILSSFAYVLAESGLFGGTIYRMTRMIDAFTGGDNADSSSLLRAYFRELGFKQFKETPILGIGMGNARLLVHHLGKDCYLHCNYAELAANGGIVGFALFYWIYAYLVKKEKDFIKYDRVSVLLFLLLFLQLVMDYGTVSYYSKRTYFMLMILVIHERNITNYQLKKSTFRNST